jgi:hypothetical protein
MSLDKNKAMNMAMRNIDTVQLCASEEYEVQLVKKSSLLVMQARLQQKLPTLVNSLLQSMLGNVKRIVETGLLIRAILNGNITLGQCGCRIRPARPHVRSSNDPHH